MPDPLRIGLFLLIRSKSDVWLQELLASPGIGAPFKTEARRELDARAKGLTKQLTHEDRKAMTPERRRALIEQAA